MRRSRVLAAAVATVTFAVPTGVGQATTYAPGPGVLCSLSSVTDPNAEGGATQFGEVHGGPLALVDDSGAPGSGTLVCTLQVGEATHVGVDQAGASAHGVGVVVLPPSTISYALPSDAEVFLCTSFVDDSGATLYWDEPASPDVPGSWSADPGASCRSFTFQLSPLAELIHALFCERLRLIDRAMGTNLADLYGCGG
jgi:hypothetical protein